MSNQRPITVVCATNDEAVLASNLLRSEPITNGQVGIELVRGAPSASAGYAGIADRLRDHLVVFAHQDVLLPRCWDACLRKHLDLLPEDWAVAGVCGVGDDGVTYGHVWSTGLDRVIGGPFEPTRCVSLDEVLLVLRPETGVDFDAKMPGFHLYATDLVQTAIRSSYSAYVIDAPVIHNSRPVALLDASYRESYRFLARKWADALPLRTCIVPVQRSLMPVLRFNARGLARGRWRRRSTIAEDSVSLSARLGFDDYAGGVEG